MISERQRFFVVPFVAFLLAATSLAGCQLEGNLNELAKELGNPDKDNFDAPGKRLVKGKFTYPAIEGNSSSGAFLTALRSDNHLTIVSYDTLERCTVGPVRAYRSPARKDTENMSASPADILMPVILAATEDAPARLVFSDLNCKLSKVTLDTTALPLSDTFAADGGLIAQDQGENRVGGVWYIDPRKGNKRIVAEGANPINNDSRVLFVDGVKGARWMLTLESGEVVGRNSKFEEVFRAGKNVQGVLYHKDVSGSAVLLGSVTDGAYVSIPLDSPDEVTTVAERVCQLKVYDGKSAREMMWTDCESKDLLYYDFASQETRTVASNVKNYRVVDQTDSGPLVLYLENGDTGDSESGPLFARWGTAKPVFLGAMGNLRMTWIDRKGAQRPVVDWDTKGRTGTLKYAPPGDALSTVAKDVAYLSSLGVISDYDGTNGRFSRLDKDKLTLVHKSVHVRGLRQDPDKTRERLLVAANVDEEGAELTLVSGESKVQKLIDRAIVDSYSFSMNSNLVTALTDADPDNPRVGTLQMVHIDRPVAQVIASGVVHALETTWPETGLLYAAPEADDPGIYFAKATR